MNGLMMDTPLTIQMILERARTFFPKKEIVTKLANGVHRYTYKDFYHRVAKLITVLDQLGVKNSDRVATFAWNNYRHLELYFAIPCSGAVLHTLNIRLAPDQLAYIINHAEDQVIFFDSMFAPLMKQLKPHLKSVKQFVVMDGGAIEDDDFKALSYEELIEAAAEGSFPELKEDMAAGLCYTSGTTGNPKGVLYSHRSLFLHSMAMTMKDNTGLCEEDRILPIVPMFHANAWGMPYTSAMIGATLVLPNQFMQPIDILKLLIEEKVTVTAGVPTIWIGVIQLLEKEQFDLSNLRVVLIGGSAVPASIIDYFDRKYSIAVLQAWGMTETSPLGSIGRLKSYMQSLSKQEQLAIKTKQGIAVPCIEIRAIGDNGQVIEWDGKSLGELQVRGPWVASGYFNTDERAEAFRDGWFSTGDIVTIDAEGYISIADRAKDLIKSGGEWISSVDLELALLGHPKIREASVIAVAHEKWVERPLACIVLKDQFKGQVSSEEIIDFLRDKFASWWLPDAVVFIDEIPKTSVGKFDKKQLRNQYKEFKLPEK